MSDATFQTFLSFGLFVLTAAIGYLAWSAWRWMDRIGDAEKTALKGIGFELEANLKRMMRELAGIADGSVRSEIQLVPVVHAQLDAFLARPTEADRRTLTMMRDNYNELSAHKNSLRAALREQGDVTGPANVAVDAVISSIATLYLWSDHKGRMPEDAHSTRSWDVRDWMKANRFDADSLPGLHLRDQVVERLRTLGMTLTPRPLTHTAHEFYSMQYDRMGDPNAPFWKRKKKPAPDAEQDVDEVTDLAAEAPVEADIEAAADPVAEPVEPVSIDEAAPVEDAAVASPEPQPELEPEPEPEPYRTAETQQADTPEPDSPEPDLGVSETEPMDQSTDLPPDQKPPSSGSVH